MKKKILSLVALFVLFAPIYAQAATLGIYPGSGKINVGKTFTVSILIDPKADKIYTAKAVVNFPADLLAEIVGGSGVLLLDSQNGNKSVIF